MVVRIVSALVLLALSVVIHSITLVAALRWLARTRETFEPGFWRSTWLLVRLAWWTVLAHMAEIGLWAAFYLWVGLFPDLDTSAYFSIVTYTTLGYGDVLASAQWRLLAGVEGLTGILMCGWSTAFFFAVVSKLYGASLDPSDAGARLRERGSDRCEGGNR